MRPSNSINIIERIISAANYITGGIVGIVWLIIGLLMKKMPTQFILYHTFQAIFIYFACFIIGKLYQLLFVIPVIKIVMYLINNVINLPITLLFGYSLLQLFTSSVIIYLIVTSLMGQYSYLPWVSDIINTNTGRR